MIIVDCEQGSEEWHKEKLGVVSASNFDKILTPTGKESTQATRYMHELIAETLLKSKPESFKSEWMERGNELEPEARQTYSFITDKQVQRVGLIYQDERKLVGCSPDGLTELGGLELKCPAAHTHVGYLLAGKLPTDYISQVQGSMLVTGRPEWDFMSYYPGLEPFIVTVLRDNTYIRKLEMALAKFIHEMKEKLSRLQEIEL